MKRTYQTTQGMHVVSEPGDMTRYDYHMIPDGPDGFTIAPGLSTFMFPQRINIWDARSIADGNEPLMIEYAKKYSCNQNTVLEVANACLDCFKERR